MHAVAARLQRSKRDLEALERLTPERRAAGRDLLKADHVGRAPEHRFGLSGQAFEAPRDVPGQDAQIFSVRVVRWVLVRLPLRTR